jgi:hypothetical protein
MREHPERDRRDCPLGLPEPTSSDSARASEALGQFISDTVACLDVQR